MTKHLRNIHKVVMATKTSASSPSSSSSSSAAAKRGHQQGHQVPAADGQFESSGNGQPQQQQQGFFPGHDESTNGSSISSFQSNSDMSGSAVMESSPTKSVDSTSMVEVLPAGFQPNQKPQPQPYSNSYGNAVTVAVDHQYTLPPAATASTTEQQVSSPVLDQDVVEGHHHHNHLEQLDQDLFDGISFDSSETTASSSIVTVSLDDVIQFAQPVVTDFC